MIFSKTQIMQFVQTLGVFSTVALVTCVVVELCLDTLEEEVDDLDEESISNQYMVNEWSLRKNYIFI